MHGGVDDFFYAAYLPYGILGKPGAQQELHPTIF